MSDPLTSQQVHLLLDIESGKFDRDDPPPQRIYSEDTLDDLIEAGLVTFYVGPGWQMTPHGCNQLAIYRP